MKTMKTVVVFLAGAVAGLMLAACLTVQGSHPGVFGGEALILPLMAVWMGTEGHQLDVLGMGKDDPKARWLGDLV